MSVVFTLEQKDSRSVRGTIYINHIPALNGLRHASEVSMAYLVDSCSPSMKLMERKVFRSNS